MRATFYFCRLLTTLSAIGIVSVSATAAVTGVWSPGAQTFSPREKHSISCDPATGSVLLFGGRPDILSSNLNDVWSYTASNRRWEQLHPVGAIPPREATGVALLRPNVSQLDADVAVFAGRDHKTAAVYRDVWMFDRALNRWRDLSPRDPEDPRPLPRYRHQVVAVNRTAFVSLFGTSADRHFNDVWLFDVVTLRWQRLHSGEPGATTPYPSPRFDPCCDFVATRNSVLCFGGTTAAEDVNELWEFFLSNNTWRIIASSGPAPSARRLAMCAAITTPRLALYVFAGFSSTIDTNVPTNESYTVGLADGSWLAHDTGRDANASAAPLPRDGGRMCALSGTSLLLFGGLGIDRVTRNDVWAVDSSLSMRLTQIRPQTLLPEPRAGHAMAVMGPRILIGFGSSRRGVEADVWAYAPESDAWTKLGADRPAGGLTETVGVARGAALWFVFGKDAASTRSNQIVVFDTETSRWSVEHFANDPPSGRAGHGALIHGDLLFVVGGNTDAAKYTSDVFVYNPTPHVWYQAAPAPFISRAYFGFVLDTVRSSPLVLGGIGSRGTLFDRWVLDRAVETNATHFTVTFSELSSAAAEPGRQFIRGQAGIAGMGSHWFVCGGAVSDSFAVAAADSCYAWNAATGVNSMTSPLPVPTRLGSAVLYRDSMYYFGGELLSGGIFRVSEFKNTMQRLSFASRTCSPTTAPSQDTNCIFCAPGSAPGSVGTNCELTPAGLYRRAPTVAASACVNGTFSALRGASDSTVCAPCPAGTYGPRPGLTQCLPCAGCPVGSVAQTALSGDAAIGSPSGRGELVTAESLRRSGGVATGSFRPERFVSDGLAAVHFITVIVIVAVIFVVVSVLFALQFGYHRLRWRYYLGSGGVELARHVYGSHMRSFGHRRPLGLSHGAVNMAMHDIADAVGVTTPRLTYDVVDMLLRFHDLNGAMTLSEFDFMDSLCTLFEMSPHDLNERLHEAEDDGWESEQEEIAKEDEEADEGDEEARSRRVARTEAAAARRQARRDPRPVLDPCEHSYFSETKKPLTDYAIANAIRKIDFSRLDAWTGVHGVFSLGDAPVFMRTTSGGIVTIVLLTIIIVLFYIIFAQFITDNHAESTASVSSLVVDDVFSAKVTVIVSTAGLADASACIAATAQPTPPGAAPIYTTACAPNTVIGTASSSAPGFTAESGPPAGTQECAFVRPRQCLLRWTCERCRVPKSAALTFLYGDNQWFSSQTTVEIITSTSIDGKDARAFASAIPTVASRSFKGFPAMNVQLALTPTKFVVEKMSGEETTTGFHVTPSNVVRGNEAEISALTHYSGVPIDIEFTPSASILIVKREMRRNVVDLVSLLLSVISGTLALAGGFVLAGDRVYMRLQQRREKIARRRMRRLRREQLGDESFGAGSRSATEPYGTLPSRQTTASWNTMQVVSFQSEEPSRDAPLRRTPSIALERTASEASLGASGQRSDRECSQYRTIENATVGLWSRMCRAGLKRNTAKAILVAVLQTIHLASENPKLVHKTNAIQKRVQSARAEALELALNDINMVDEPGMAELEVARRHEHTIRAIANNEQPNPEEMNALLKDLGGMRAEARNDLLAKAPPDARRTLEQHLMTHV